MSSVIVQLDGATIVDWASFHRASQIAFGFPDFYGHNLDAWIDCLTYLYEDDGMSRVVLSADEILEIQLLHSAKFAKAAPAVMDGLRDVVAAVNDRLSSDGQPTILLHLL